MRQTDNIDTHNIVTNHITTQPFKVSTANVNDLNNLSKRTKIYNLLKTNKLDLALLQETHSTKITEIQWKNEWVAMSFWNGGPNHQTARVAILFNKKFEGRLQNIENDNTGGILSIFIGPFQINQTIENTSIKI